MARSLSCDEGRREDQCRPCAVIAVIKSESDAPEANTPSPKDDASKGAAHEVRVPRKLIVAHFVRGSFVTDSAEPTAKRNVPAATGARRPRDAPLARQTRRDFTEHFGQCAAGGRVTLDDVKAFVRKHIARPAPASSRRFTIPPLPDFSKYGPIEKKPFSDLRKKIAENLTISVHVAHRR